jgi:hypothetical protein
MKFKTWLYLEFHKDTVINQISSKVQSSSGVLILQNDNTWSGSFDHARLFSWNKAHRLCKKMNKNSKEYGKKHGKSYSVYNTITNCDSFVIRKVHILEYILHKLLGRHVYRCSSDGIYYCRICWKEVGSPYK